MTSRKQISLFTEETLISSAGASLVSPTAPQVKDWGKMTSDISGPICLDAFGRFPRVGSWAKTFSALLIGQAGWSSTKCRLTWKLKGTKYNRMYFQLQASTLPTEGTEFGLLPTEMLPTPNSRDWKDNVGNGRDAPSIGKTRGYSLGQKINSMSGMLPTPTMFDYNSARTPEKYEEDKAKYAEKGVNLQMPLKQMARNGMLPTPCAQEGGKITGKENQDSLTKRAREQTGKTSQLNPQFVAEMMGFPTDWTILPFLSGETNQSKPTATQ